MMPSHHPCPETLVAYASGTLPEAAACMVACHLSLCAQCGEQVRWLERLGGVMLSNLEIDHDAEALADDAEALAERAVARWSLEGRHDAPEAGQIPEMSDPLLTSPLARYMAVNGAEMSWRPVEHGIEECGIELSNHDGAIRLWRLSPGQHFPEPGTAAEAEAAMVLKGACRNSAGTYARGDVIERTAGPANPLMALGETECICLIAGQAVE